MATSISSLVLTSCSKVKYASLMIIATTRAVMSPGISATNLYFHPNADISCPPVDSSFLLKADNSTISRFKNVGHAFILNNGNPVSLIFEKDEFDLNG